MYFCVVWCFWVLEGILGCILGCALGLGGVLHFIWGVHGRKAERGATGGFALPEERARECHGKWDEKKECYPTEKQLQDRRKKKK